MERRVTILVDIDYDHDIWIIGGRIVQLASTIYRPLSICVHQSKIVVVTKSIF